MDDDLGPARGRRRNLAAIVNLYGAPGFERDTPRGRELLLGVIEEMPGLTALTKRCAGWPTAIVRRMQPKNG